MGSTTKPAAATKPDRIDLRLYNTIIVYDVYTVGHTEEAARESLLAAILSGEAKPTETIAREVTMSNSIRTSWLEQKPWYASDVSDDEFEQFKTMTTSAVWDRFYKRQP